MQEAVEITACAVSTCTSSDCEQKRRCGGGEVYVRLVQDWSSFYKCVITVLRSVLMAHRCGSAAPVPQLHRQC